MSPMSDESRAIACDLRHTWFRTTRLCLRTRYDLELVDDRFHFLRVIASQPEHCIVSLDDDDILETNRRNQPLTAENVGVRAVLEHDVPYRRVAEHIVLRRSVKRRPGADITPTSPQRHHEAVRGFLHDSMIDRARRAPREIRRQRDDAIRTGASDAALARSEDFGRVLTKLL